MNARFILPATVAAVAHLSVLYGVRWPHLPPEPAIPTEPATKITAVDWTNSEEPPVNPYATPAPGPRGTPDLRPSGLDETAARPHPGDFEMPRQAPTPGPITHPVTIAPGIFGDPNSPGGDGNGRSPAILDSKSLDHEPRTRSQVSPVYPSAAASTGRHGEVLVEFVVDEDGRVRHPRVVRSSDAMFEAPTLRAVERWRFEPGRKDGRVVRFRLALPVRFNLNS
jgi:periplasmic protein TonB